MKKDLFTFILIIIFWILIRNRILHYNIMLIMSSPPSQAVFSYHQPHILHPPAVLFAGRYDINAGCVDAAVAEDVGKLGDVLLDAVKRAGKQVA